MNNPKENILLNHWNVNVGNWAFLDFTEDQVADWISFMVPEDAEQEFHEAELTVLGELAAAYIALGQGYCFYAYQCFLSAGRKLLLVYPQDQELVAAVEKFGMKVESIGILMGKIAAEQRQREEVFKRLFSQKTKIK